MEAGRGFWNCRVPCFCMFHTIHLLTCTWSQFLLSVESSFKAISGSRETGNSQYPWWSYQFCAMWRCRAWLVLLYGGGSRKKCTYCYRRVTRDVKLCRESALTCICFHSLAESEHCSSSTRRDCFNPDVVLWHWVECGLQLCLIFFFASYRLHTSSSMSAFWNVSHLCCPCFPPFLFQPTAPPAKDPWGALVRDRLPGLPLDRWVLWQLPGGKSSCPGYVLRPLWVRKYLEKEQCWK